MEQNPGRVVEVGLAQQKQRLRDGQVEAVVESLPAHLKPKEIAAQHAPVRACYRYLSNRLHQVDYPQTLAAQLPIRSGEIESACRYMIQERLKRPGVW